MKVLVTPLLLVSLVLISASLIQPTLAGSGNCDQKCGERCAKAGIQDSCLKHYGICYEECKCVPSGTYCNEHECPCYRDKKNNKGYCDQKCGERCAKEGVQDSCLNYCGISCEDCKCIPSETYGNKHECTCCRDKNSTGYCDKKCGERCAKAGVQDWCLKYCGICCEDSKCIPSETYGNKHECPCCRDKNSTDKPQCP